MAGVRQQVSAKGHLPGEVTRGLRENGAKEEFIPNATFCTVLFQNKNLVGTSTHHNTTRGRQDLRSAGPEQTPPAACALPLGMHFSPKTPSPCLLCEMSPSVPRNQELAFKRQLTSWDFTELLRPGVTSSLKALICQPHEPTGREP